MPSAGILIPLRPCICRHLPNARVKAGMRLTLAVANWTPMISSFSVLAPSVDRLLDMETYSANSMEGWLNGDAYGGCALCPFCIVVSSFSFFPLLLPLFHFILFVCIPVVLRSFVIRIVLMCSPCAASLSTMVRPSTPSHATVCKRMHLHAHACTQPC